MESGTVETRPGGVRTSAGLRLFLPKMSDEKISLFVPPTSDEKMSVVRRINAVDSSSTSAPPHPPDETRRADVAEQKLTDIAFHFRRLWAALEQVERTNGSDEVQKEGKLQNNKARLKTISDACSISTQEAQVLSKLLPYLVDTTASCQQRREGAVDAPTAAPTVVEAPMVVGTSTMGADGTMGVDSTTVVEATATSTVPSTTRSTPATLVRILPTTSVARSLVCVETALCNDNELLRVLRTGEYSEAARTCIRRAVVRAARAGEGDRD